MTKPDSGLNLSEYSVTVVLTKKFKVVAPHDMGAQNQVIELVENEVSDESGWRVSDVNYTRTDVPIC